MSRKQSSTSQFRRPTRLFGCAFAGLDRNVVSRNNLGLHSMIQAMYKAILAVCLVAVCAALCIAGAMAQPVPQKVQARLIAPTLSIHAGQPFTVGLEQIIAPNWHTYWKNPGDSGEPTRLTWKLPAGFVASEIRWPLPSALPVGPLTNYGYSDTLLLPSTITPPAGLSAGTITLHALAEWLVCEKICIPEQQDVSLTLKIVAPDTPLIPSSDSGKFADVQRLMPIDLGWPADIASDGKHHFELSIRAAGLRREEISNVRFFPDEWGMVDHAAPQMVTWSADSFSLRLKRGERATNGLPQLSGVLVLTEKLDDRYVRNGFVVRTGASTGNEALSSGASAAHDGRRVGITLWQAALFALLGGMLLNLMPCVLPVLSLKVMALTQYEPAQSATAKKGGLAYLAGVLASFLALAVILLMLRAAGETLGWGFQFQSPRFVLSMAALFFVLGLSMSGVFDIGGNIVGFGENLTRHHGLAGSFFTGVLASIAATPCTAPFMGAAVGYAVGQPAVELVVVLPALGGGFALPVTALSVYSGTRRWLPQPGPWMETLKQALAFPLYATTAWLIWVLSQQSGSDGVLAAAIVLIGLGFATWLFGCTGAGWPMRRGIAMAIAATSFAGALFQVSAITPNGRMTTGATSAMSDAGRSEPYSAARLAQLRAEGRPVFVNFTAAWCITCKVNEHVALKSDAFREVLKAHNAAYLVGDWTNKNDAIARLLKSYGRAGVPLYLIYPGKADAKALVLPQLLTEAIVIRHFASLAHGATAPKP